MKSNSSRSVKFTNLGNINHADVQGDDDGGVSFPRMLKFASLFLLWVILIQVYSVTNDRGHGPLELFGAIATYYFFGYHEIEISHSGGVGSSKPYIGHLGGNILASCPPDPYLDEPYFDVVFSEEHDPRNKNAHTNVHEDCELNRWVKLTRSKQRKSNEKDPCSAGSEYSTVIRSSKPRSMNQTATSYNGIPKIIHLASPTSCLPSQRVKALKQLLDSGSPFNDYTIYVHSNYAMDRFIMAREWSVFPEVKEGALCTAEKVKQYVTFALENLGMDHAAAVNSTNTKMAEDAAIQGARDIWKYLILWEYGGIVLDVDTLSHFLPWDEGGESNNQYLDRILQLYSKDNQDAILFWINVDKTAGRDKKDKSRLPFTQIMGLVPQHPHMFFVLKWAIKWGSDDIPLARSPKAGKITRGDLPRNNAFYFKGRNTDIPPVNEGLRDFLPNSESLPIDALVPHTGRDGSTMLFLNGDEILPPALTSSSPSWKMIFSALRVDNEKEEESVRNKLISAQQLASEQNRVLFSCMKHRLKIFSKKNDVRR